MDFHDGNGLSIAPKLMPQAGVLMGAIDDTEYSNFKYLLTNIFGAENYVGSVAVEVNPAGQNIRPNVPARSHDYFHIYSKNIDSINMILRGLTAEERKQYKEKDSIGAFYWDNLRRRGGNSRPSDRPKQWFPLYIDGDKIRVPEMKWDDGVRKWIVNDAPKQGEVETWPIDPKGEERIWRVNPDGAKLGISNKEISIIEKAGRQEISKKSREPEGKKPKTLWADSKYSATSHGTKLLLDILGTGAHFSYPKSLYLTQDAIRYWADEEATTLDFFAGSGTTGHAVINLNREDEGQRKYVLVEMGKYFSTATHPRILKAAYSKDWKDGKPVSREGVSHILKYMALEQYEDALDNLGLNKSETQAALLASNPTLNEQYMLDYMLDVESRGSQSLLNIDAFADPFAYTLRITRNDDTQLVKVDLLETFNYLLGLTIRTVDRDKTGIVTVTGKNALGENCLIIWRNTLEVDNAKLDAWFGKRYSSKDFEFDAIYVNGDNNIENMKLADDHWKVRLIEAEFKRLMFDVQDV